MSEPTPPTYRTTNWRSYSAALKQRGSLLIWFDPETVWLAEPSGKRGRSATFTDAAIQACLTLRARFGLPLRQTTGLVASLLELAGLDWTVPDFSTLSRRQNGLNVAIPYRPSTDALHLLIDSTGIKVEGEGEWFAKKHGPSKPRQWRKMHIGIDADTLEIRAIEVTGSQDNISLLKGGIDSDTPVFNTMINRLETVVSHSDAPLLLVGEAGSGKSHLAQHIYELKLQRHRVKGRLIQLNCASLRGPQALPTLFGQRRSVTGIAGTERAGLRDSFLMICSLRARPRVFQHNLPLADGRQSCLGVQYRHLVDRIQDESFRF